MDELFNLILMTSIMSFWKKHSEMKNHYVNWKILRLR